ncbi:MAG TPA: Holliday junction resolvase-like protein [Acidimicrobiales bacterium]|nr:Holliday junction resolvase-like protein [Acidimicrobiales bacterium]
MREVLLALLAGALTGAFVGYTMLRRSAWSEAQARFEAWRAGDVHRLRLAAVADGRAELKLAVGRQVAGGLPALPFAAADARFIGDPVAFVVFDGHTDVKDRNAADLRAVCFVALGSASYTTSEAELVRECVADGRVRWETLSLGSRRPA